MNISHIKIYFHGLKIIYKTLAWYFTMGSNISCSRKSSGNFFTSLSFLMSVISNWNLRELFFFSCTRTGKKDPNPNSTYFLQGISYYFFKGNVKHMGIMMVKNFISLSFFLDTNNCLGIITIRSNTRER